MTVFAFYCRKIHGFSWILIIIMVQRFKKFSWILVMMMTAFSFYCQVVIFTLGCANLHIFRIDSDSWVFILIIIIWWELLHLLQKASNSFSWILIIFMEQRFKKFSWILVMTMTAFHKPKSFSTILWGQSSYFPNLIF